MGGALMASVTMKDVARLAGVSTATVSRTLEEPELVRPATREKIMIAVQKLKYEPNLLARNLRKNESRFVIAVLPDITNPFFSKIVRGMEDVAHAEGYNLLVCNTDNDADRELDYIRILQRRGADGIIFLSARVDNSHIVALSKLVPVVMACECPLGIPVPSVSIDNTECACMATEHLIRLGHRRIGFINGPGGLILSVDRLAGYQLALQRAGIPLDDQIIREGDYTHASGVATMEELLRLPNRPTAIFAANDEMAIGAINAASGFGLHVPKDLAVVGFDDIAFADMYKPRLTTIAQPTTKIGSTAMEMLLSLIRGETMDSLHVILPARLVMRESCRSVL